MSVSCISGCRSERWLRVAGRGGRGAPGGVPAEGSARRAEVERAVGVVVAGGVPRRASPASPVAAAAVHVARPALIVTALLHRLLDAAPRVTRRWSEGLAPSLHL